MGTATEKKGASHINTDNNNNNNTNNNDTPT